MALGLRGAFDLRRLPRVVRLRCVIDHRRWVLFGAIAALVGTAVVIRSDIRKSSTSTGQVAKSDAQSVAKPL